MKIWKFKKYIEINKTIGNFHIKTFQNVWHENGKPKLWSELHCWYEQDCEHCPLGWGDIDYEGECYDCGCYMAERGKDYPKIMLICMLPRWIKKILLKRKIKSEG